MAAPWLVKVMTMIKKTCLSLLLVLVTFNPLFVTHAEPQQQAIAFTNVNVVPFDRERILPGQTVVVRDGRIAEIGSAEKIKVPAGALQIDGRGKYLMPALADMHVHLFPGAGQPDDLANQQLQLFLANGVTTIRNMIGKPEHLVLRDRVAKASCWVRRFTPQDRRYSATTCRHPKQQSKL